MPVEAGDNPIRDYIGIAIDGGGVRGAMVAHGIMALEQKLGLKEGEALIDHPQMKVLAGTSTGSLIAGCLALGMRGEEILTLYKKLGERVFSQSGPLHPLGRTFPLLDKVRLPGGTIRFLLKVPFVGDFLVLPFFPWRYSIAPLREVILEEIQKRLPDNPNPTLEDIANLLAQKPNQPTIIFTAVEVAARRTHFLKTLSSERYKNMKFVDALLASSSIPTYFDPISLPVAAGEKPRWLTDGGVGSFGNPALVVAWEMCDDRNTNPNRQFNPSVVTVYSFGTGYYPTERFEKAFGPVTRWWALKWAPRIPDLFGTDATREQSRNIVSQYRGIDLRRFQLSFDKVVASDDFGQIDDYLAKQGAVLAQRVRENLHAFVGQEYDPESIEHYTITPLLQG